MILGPRPAAEAGHRSDVAAAESAAEALGPAARAGQRLKRALAPASAASAADASGAAAFGLSGPSVVPASAASAADAPGPGPRLERRTVTLVRRRRRAARAFLWPSAQHVARPRSHLSTRGRSRTHTPPLPGVGCVRRSSAQGSRLLSPASDPGRRAQPATVASHGIVACLTVL